MIVPNQKVVIINKPKFKEGFLQIANEDWRLAFKTLTHTEFGLYLYLSNNADGFNLELSQVAVENALGLKKISYYDAIKGLVEKGYLVKSEKRMNVLNFYPYADSKRVEVIE